MPAAGYAPAMAERPFEEEVQERLHQQRRQLRRLRRLHLLAVVILKLFFVDMSSLDLVARIVSFITVGIRRLTLSVCTTAGTSEPAPQVPALLRQTQLRPRRRKILVPDVAHLDVLAIDPARDERHGSIVVFRPGRVCSCDSLWCLRLSFPSKPPER